MPDATTAQEAVMIRSEERLRVATRSVAIGRAVLRRVIVTEQRTVVVEVRREEVRLEVLPFDGPDAEDDGPHLPATEPPGFVLHEERIEITKRIVPVERVRLELRSVRTEREVTEDVRHEEVVAEARDAETPV